MGTLAATLSTTALRPLTGVAAAAQQEAVSAAIGRLLGRGAEQFVLGHLDRAPGEAEAFEIAGEPGRITLSGSSPVAQLSGLHWWLKHVAGGHLSANGDQLNLPAVLPAPDGPVRMSTEMTERYAYNMTVFGYTAPYWGWSEWERELDRQAASGTNRALALIGQDAVWYDTFVGLGLSDLDVRKWIALPAHQPWQWYGGITGYEDPIGMAGPMTAGLLRRRRALGARIVARMRELGITPVFPAFVGHVPSVLAAQHPEAHVPAQRDYAGQPRPHWLDCTDPLYPVVAERFYRAQAQYFGTTTHYSNDLFHEVGDDELPVLLDGANLADAARAVQAELERAVPGAVWVLQGWQANPRREVVDAVDKHRVLVLDLDSDDARKWETTEAYWGAPWCWGTIQNFGGRLGMFGNLIEPGRTLQAVRTSEHRGWMVGTAMVLEGIHHNPVVADLLAELPWRHDQVDLESWVLGYARRRYGVDDPHAARAWQILLRTAYSYASTGHTSGEGPFETPFALEPTLTPGSASMWGPKTWRYDPAEFQPCLGELLAVRESARGLATYRYDLVDVTRQVLANRGRLLLEQIAAAYRAGDRAQLARHCKRFLRALDLTEQVLATHEQWLLGRWVAQARSWGTTAQERRSLEHDARSLVTIWSSPAAHVLREYANRDWHGLLGSYYKPRWQRFFNALPGTIASGVPPRFDDWARRGEEWIASGEEHATRPSGNTYAVARRIADELAADPL
ncbi:alpha-N-acetylglucosaminidase [Umezawaea beigongshangensis]|uniref:alpha-N-acetylglucosaminidase n=1 Tax=Umezawaea beigongshangensis TaxID=2780383 RepID=UPI0018F17DB6|nr:alpha-N-acetylglucosaminidase [Umezawaea beigongshangensis]